MNKVFVTGDLHGDAIARFSYSKNPLLRETIQEGDIAVCLGDCGIVDWPGFEKQCDYMLDWLNDKPQTTILLYGNHDNYDAIQKYPVIEKYGGYVRQVRDKVFAVDFPTILNLNESRCLLIPGAESHDTWNLYYPWDKRRVRDARKRNKWYRVVGESWWPQERINVPACSCLLDVRYGMCGDNHFDYVLSHDCVGYMHDSWKRSGSPARMIPTEGENFLSGLSDMLQYKTWWHGHCHEEFYPYGKEEKNIVCIYHRIFEIDSLYKPKQNKSF